jgi:hypothetical protein
MADGYTGRLFCPVKGLWAKYICNLPIKLPLYTGNNPELRLLIGYSFIICALFF